MKVALKRSLVDQFCSGRTGERPETAAVGRERTAEWIRSRVRLLNSIVRQLDLGLDLDLDLLSPPQICVSPFVDSASVQPQFLLLFFFMFLLSATIQQ